MKFSKKFNKDWEFYLTNLHRKSTDPEYDQYLDPEQFANQKEYMFTFSGSSTVLQPIVESGYYAKEAFYLMDSKGGTYDCREPELLRDVLVLKKGINFQIKQWVEGYNDMFMGVDVYISEFINPPSWLRKSFVNQLSRGFLTA